MLWHPCSWQGGFPVSFRHPDARRFCAMGALLLAASEVCSAAEDADNLAKDIAKMISPTGSLVFINDHRGHAAVLALFDQAIAASKRKRPSMTDGHVREGHASGPQ